MWSAVMNYLSKQLALTIIALGLCGTSGASDGFIVQPKLKAKLNEAAESGTGLSAPKAATNLPTGQTDKQSDARETPLSPSKRGAPLNSGQTARQEVGDQSADRLELGNLELGNLELGNLELGDTVGHPAGAGLQWVARHSADALVTSPQPSLNAPAEFEADRGVWTTSEVSPQAPSRGTWAGANAPEVAGESAPTRRPPIDHPTTTGDATVPPATSGPSEQQPAHGKQREVIVSLVSNRILDGFPSRPTSGAVPPLENPEGWQAVGERLSQHLSSCELLLRRNAFFSAREEAVEAMLHLVRRLDQAENRLHCEPAYLAARQAFNEADDFSLSQRLVSDESLLRRLVNSHETPILKNADLAQLSPMTAAQHYRLYAEQSLYEAAQGHPWASEVIYAIGRSYQAEADNSGNQADSRRLRAVSHFRVALRIVPSNALASNQLGFIMLQMDRPIEAREMLLASIMAAPSAAALQNLMEAGRRLGDQQTTNWAAQNLAGIRAHVRQPMASPAVVEVDPRTFAAMSPRSSGPVPPTSPANADVSTASYSPAGGYR